MIADVPSRRVSRRSEHIFYVGMSVAVIAMTFAGFAKTWFLRSYFDNPQALPLTTLVHGIAFTAWVLFLLVQTTLVAAHRTDIHRKLGWLGAGLAAFMVVIAVRTAITAVHAAVVCCDAEAARGFFIVPIADAVVFGVLVGYAVVNRRDTGAHKRLMLLATLVILDAATGRWPLRIIQAWPYTYMVIVDAVILAVVGYDTFTRKQLARAYAWGVPFVFGAHVARELIRTTPAWKSLARILVG